QSCRRRSERRAGPMAAHSEHELWPEPAPREGRRRPHLEHDAPEANARRDDRDGADSEFQVVPGPRPALQSGVLGRVMGHHNRRYNCKHQFRSSRGTSVGVTADGIAKEGLTLKSDWQERISVNPKVCHGKPCIKGTRIMVSIN